MRASRGCAYWSRRSAVLVQSWSAAANSRLARSWKSSAISFSYSGERYAFEPKLGRCSGRLPHRWIARVVTLLQGCRNILTPQKPRQFASAFQPCNRFVFTVVGAKPPARQQLLCAIFHEMRSAFKERIPIASHDPFCLGFDGREPINGSWPMLLECMQTCCEHLLERAALSLSCLLYLSNIFRFGVRAAVAAQRAIVPWIGRTTSSRKSIIPLGR